MDRRLAPAAASPLLALVVLGCGSILGPGPDRVVGLVEGIEPDDPRITVPDTVAAGASFTVSVVSYGLSGCWQKDDTEVKRAGATATVTPYDLEPRDDPRTDCTTVIRIFEHTATLRFDQPGTAVVTFRGRSLDREGPVSFERVVVVE